MVGRMVRAGDESHSSSDPLHAAREAAEAAGERLGNARAGAGERLGAARDAAGKQMAAARESAAMAAHAAAHKLSQKPRLRGVSHQWAFFVSLGAGAALILAASGTRAVIAMSIYAFSLSAMLGTSALYHRVTWTPDVRQWMRRLDHTMIFVFIAGTYTPFALLVMHGTLANLVLIVVWATALAGMILNLVWIRAPYWFTAVVYLSTGWVAIVTLPQLWNEIGPVGSRDDRPRWRPLLRWCRRLCAPQARSPTGGLRLPRDLPRPGDRGRRDSVRRGGDLRTACRLSFIGTA